MVLALAIAAAAAPVPRFVQVNGVRLHYLDWGGKGEALLFLTALSGTAGDFEPLAVPFTDRFHVLSLTRRGQGNLTSRKAAMTRLRWLRILKLSWTR